MSDSLALPPRGELFADASARAVWAAITALPAALQHQVLAALRDLLACLDGTTTGETRVRHAVRCLCEARDLLGHSPSVGEYRRLHASRGRELQWPSDSNIRSWLGGSWNDCLREARLAPVPDGDVLVAGLGSAFTADEITEALRECASELGDVPTISQYYAWSRRGDVVARPGRRPQSQSPFVRTFGGYAPALKAAGLIDGEHAGAAKRSTVVRVGSYFITNELIGAALREVAERLDRSPRTADYQLEREKVITESIEAGQPRSLPAVSTIQKAYGNWDAALVDAGLVPLGGRATRSKPRSRSGSGRRINDSDALAVLREAYAVLGDPFTVSAFHAWRREQLERDRLERRWRSLPTYDLYRSRWGTWRNALQAAFSSDSDSGTDQAAPIFEPDKGLEATDQPSTTTEVNS